MRRPQCQLDSSWCVACRLSLRVSCAPPSAADRTTAWHAPCASSTRTDFQSGRHEREPAANDKTREGAGRRGGEESVGGALVRRVTLWATRQLVSPPPQPPSRLLFGLRRTPLPLRPLGLPAPSTVLAARMSTRAFVFVVVTTSQSPSRRVDRRRTESVAAGRTEEVQRQAHPKASRMPRCCSHPPSVVAAVAVYRVRIPDSKRCSMPCARRTCWADEMPPPVRAHGHDAPAQP